MRRQPNTRYYRDINMAFDPLSFTRDADHR